MSAYRNARIYSNTDSPVEIPELVGIFWNVSLEVLPSVQDFPVSILNLMPTAVPLIACAPVAPM